MEFQGEPETQKPVSLPGKVIISSSPGFLLRLATKHDVLSWFLQISSKHFFGRHHGRQNLVLIVIFTCNF